MTVAEEIRQKLGHPVIDADGHNLEFRPAFNDFLKQVGGTQIVRRYASLMRERIGPYWFQMDEAERRHHGAPRLAWWGTPARSTDDHATAILPGLLRSRLDSLGIDFGIVYPTLGLFFMREEDAELRQACCRALNIMQAELFSPHSDRLTPVATIPMFSPAEAIAEAEFAVKTLGLKSILISGFVRRPMPAALQYGAAAAGVGHILDMLALDSEHDYDPFWQRCLDLKVSPAVHSAMMAEGARISPTSYAYNHIGMFGAAHEAFAKALIMGGVTKRFPALKFAFLEGGLSWAVELCNGLAGHWEKRNGKAMDNYNPSHLDIDRLCALFKEYGEPALQQPVDKLKQSLERVRDIEFARREVPDEFAASGIQSQAHLMDMFAGNFFFGCEADDRSVAMAYDPRLLPEGRSLKPLFGSDIGHWDVVEIEKVLVEAYEQVERGALTPKQFRAFVFDNPVDFYTSSNPHFFDGTSIA